jgi:hypothetical protein
MEKPVLFERTQGFGRYFATFLDVTRCGGAGAHGPVIQKWRGCGDGRRGDKDDRGGSGSDCASRSHSIPAARVLTVVHGSTAHDPTRGRARRRPLNIVSDRVEVSVIDVDIDRIGAAAPSIGDGLLSESAE